MIRRLREDEATALCELRLRALADAPRAFAATLEEERARPPEAWSEAARAGAAGITDVTFLAVEGDNHLGLITGRLLAPPAAWLEALWVDPSARGHGHGRALIEAVAAWARERGATRLDLSVTDNNAAAAALYAAAGFTPTGRRRPLPSDPTRLEIFLTRAL